MMRISPLSEMNDETATTERSYAWPFYCQDRGAHTLLWPLIDWDKNGVAVRPIYNQEGDDKSILFPLSGWDKNSGWVLNYYWGQEANGAFPFFHQNKNKLSYYTLFWNDKSDNTGGV